MSARLASPIASWLKKWLPMRHEHEAKSRQQDPVQLQKEYSNGQVFLDRSPDTYLKELITEEEYRRRKKEREDALHLVK